MGQKTGTAHSKGGGRNAYIDRDASETIKARKPSWYIDRYDLDSNDRQIAREAARRLISYRMWYVDYREQKHGESYESETAEAYVDRMMGSHEDGCEEAPRAEPHSCTCGMSAGESTKRRTRILQTALAMVLNPDDEDEEGLSLSGQTFRRKYSRDAA